MTITLVLFGLTMPAVDRMKIAIDEQMQIIKILKLDEEARNNSEKPIFLNKTTYFPNRTAKPTTIKLKYKKICIYKYYTTVKKL